MSCKSVSKPEKWILLGIPLLFSIGSILHFAYDFLMKSPLAGIFAAVNESIWEHEKMVVWPVILWWSLYYILKGKMYGIHKNRWFTGALASLFISLVTMPMLYYFYTEAFGVEILWVDILILLLTIAFGQLMGLHVYQHGKGIPAAIVCIIFVLLILIFILFTFFPPHIPLFQDGITSGYGIL